MKSARALLTGVAMIAIASGCEIKKTADEMKKSTNEILENSRHLAKRTDDLEAELTKKESHDMLFFHLDMVFGEGEFKDAQDKNTDPDQIVAAGAAVQSMLFQYWKGDYNEDLQFLDARYSLVAQAFFPRLIKHIPRDFNVDVMIPDRSYKGVAALGSMLDEMDHRYAQALRNNNLTNLSFYDVIIEALRGRDLITRTERLPIASQRILEYADEAKYLLQLRHNYLPMIVICRMTQFQDWNDMHRLWVRFMGFQGKIEEKTPAALAEWTKYLRLALQTRKDLRAMGIEPEYNGMLNGIVQSLNFDQARWINMDPAALSAEDKVRRDFAVAYNQVVLEALTATVE
jgi:hypothetical protein